MPQRHEGSKVHKESYIVENIRDRYTNINEGTDLING
jgi:hypothetical protein